MTDNNRLRIAIQKSGRLSDESRELLSRCGIKINLHTQRLIALAENMPIDILRVRDDDIPGLVMDGVVDLGIVGENVLEEELLTRRAQGDDPDSAEQTREPSNPTRAPFVDKIPIVSDGLAHRYYRFAPLLMTATGGLSPKPHPQDAPGSLPTGR